MTFKNQGVTLRGLAFGEHLTENLPFLLFVKNVDFLLTNYPLPIIHYLLCEIYALYVKLSHLCENTWALGLCQKTKVSVL